MVWPMPMLLISMDSSAKIILHGVYQCLSLAGGPEIIVLFSLSFISEENFESWIM